MPAKSIQDFYWAGVREPLPGPVAGLRPAGGPSIACVPSGRWARRLWLLLLTIVSDGNVCEFLFLGVCPIEFPRSGLVPTVLITLRILARPAE